TSSAKTYFGPQRTLSSKKSDKEYVLQFVARNPYIRKQISPADVPPLPQSSNFCPTLNGPQDLNDPQELLWNDKTKSGLPINTEAIFADVAISDAFDYLFIADSKGK